MTNGWHPKKEKESSATSSKPAEKAQETEKNESTRSEHENKIAEQEKNPSQE